MSFWRCFSLPNSSSTESSRWTLVPSEIGTLTNTSLASRQGHLLLYGDEGDREESSMIILQRKEESHLLLLPFSTSMFFLSMPSFHLKLEISNVDMIGTIVNEIADVNSGLITLKAVNNYEHKFCSSQSILSFFCIQHNDTFIWSMLSCLKQAKHL